MNEKFTAKKNEWISRINDKQVKGILIAAAIGVGLLAFSGIAQDKTPSVSSSSSIENTHQEIEEKLQSILCRIDGVGEVSVLITYEDSGQKQYLTEGTQSEESTETASGGKTQKSSQSQAVVMGGDSTGKQPILQNSLSPTIKGVVVVCDGGGNAVIKEKVIYAVSTALQVGSDRIYVTQTVRKKGT